MEDGTTSVIEPSVLFCADCITVTENVFKIITLPAGSVSARIRLISSFGSIITAE